MYRLKNKQFKLVAKAFLVLAIIFAGFGILKIGKNESLNSKSIINETRSELNGFDISSDRPHSIAIDTIVSGGVGRDGIPAIDNPKFVTASDSILDKNGLGILTTVDGVSRFYPYAILDWHEIVNDKINDKYFAVTYCPLCGSASVYDRTIDDAIVRFGVSGLLRESNLLMYDDQTESLWSQSTGRGVLGDRNGYTLTRLSTQLVTMQEAINAHPDLQILSTDTGFTRQYGSTPYIGYDETDDLYFDISVNDKRLPAKTVMYAFIYEDKAFSIPQDKLSKNQSITVFENGLEITLMKNENGEISTEISGTNVLGYFEMWFSWATQHKDNGILITI